MDAKNRRAMASTQAAWDNACPPDDDDFDLTEEERGALIDEALVCQAEERAFWRLHGED